MYHLHLFSDLSDVDENETPMPLALGPPRPSSVGPHQSPSPAPEDSDESGGQQAALNYSSVGAGNISIPSSVAGRDVSGSAQQDSGAGACSTETLLRNIQGLLKVAADNARQQERQISYEKGR